MAAAAARLTTDGCEAEQDLRPSLAASAGLPPGELAEQRDRRHRTSQRVPGDSRTLGHMGTMSMFEKLGFTATGRDELLDPGDPRYPWHFVVMRLKV
jgi:hypothetical protein